VSQSTAAIINNRKEITIIKCKHRNNQQNVSNKYKIKKIKLEKENITKNDSVEKKK